MAASATRGLSVSGAVEFNAISHHSGKPAEASRLAQISRSPAVCRSTGKTEGGSPLHLGSCSKSLSNRLARVRAWARTDADGKNGMMASREEAYAAAEKLKEDGQLEEAVAALDTLVGEHPDYALAHSAISAWCTRLERHEKAVQHARRVCELQPNDPFSFTALSMACMKAGMIAEAEDALGRSRMMTG